MPRLNDKTGHRFSRLLVIRHVGRNKHRHSQWECQCDCGKRIVVSSCALATGNTKSCGCLNDELIGSLQRTHGMSGGNRVYRIWLDMRRRCSNSERKCWHNYGGRGITICPEWSDYANFHAWALANGYHNDLTLERKNNNGNYEPENCRWATRKEQCNNTRNNVMVDFKGQIKTLKQWSEELGIKYSTLHARVRRGLASDQLFREVSL